MSNALRDKQKKVRIGPKYVRIPEQWGVVPMRRIAHEEPDCFTDGDWVEKRHMVPKEAGDYKLVQLANIGIGQFKGDSGRYVNSEFFERKNCTEVQTGNLLISRMADPVLRTCKLPESDWKHIAAVDIIIAKVDHDNWDAQYLIQQLNSKTYSEVGRSWATGTTRLRISRSNVEKLQMIRPPLQEQKNIAEILSTVDEAIQQTDEVIDKTQELKKGLMQDLLTKGIGHEEFKETEVGLIPEKWDVICLEDIAEIYQPKTISKTDLKDNGEYPVFGANGYIGFYNDYNHATEQVTISCRGAKSGTTNYVDQKTWITGNSMVVNIQRVDVSKTYVYFQLSLQDLSYMITGSAQPQIIKRDVAIHQIPLPPPTGAEENRRHPLHRRCQD